MKDNRTKLILLQTLFSVVSVVATVVNAKVLSFHFGQLEVLVSGSAFYFVISYIILNLVTAGGGASEGKRCIQQGIVCQVVAAILFFIVSLLPGQDPNMESSYNSLLGTNWLFVSASIVAAAISQFIQVHLFKLFSKRMKNSVSNLVSLICSQLVDTALFATAAFGVGSSWLFSAEGFSMLINLIVSQYIVKVVIVLISAPLFPILLRKVFPEGSSWISKNTIRSSIRELLNTSDRYYLKQGKMGLCDDVTKRDFDFTHADISFFDVDTLYEDLDRLFEKEVK